MLLSPSAQSGVARTCLWVPPETCGRIQERLGTPAGRLGRMFRYPTVVGSPHMLLVHMSTNGCAYPHIVWAYPHLGTRAKPPEIRLFWSLSPSLGVQHLPEGTDVPAEVVVLRHLALDPFAAVEDR